jgi:hypothetical protein
VNRKWAYIVAGSSLIAAGVAILAIVQRHEMRGGDPIEEAQRMLTRAQTKLSEIESGLRQTGRLAEEPA